MKSIIPFLLGVALTALIALFGGNNYVSGLTESYQDSILKERNINKFKYDSIYTIFDSLKVQQKEKDTILINIFKYEKIYISSVDTMQDSTIGSAIRNYLYY